MKKIIRTVENILDQCMPIPDTGCYLWEGHWDINGYGQISFHRKTVRVHRVVWIIKNGPITSQQYVCHRCDMPPCCNPDHLFLGTCQDNVTDKMVKGRHRTNPARGELSATAKLSDAQVIEIKTRYMSGGISQEALGAEYGVSGSNVSRILSGNIRSTACAR